MPLLIPDPNRQTPSSISPASDLCRKWTLWHRGDHLDSLICCKLFPAKHALADADIARALASLHKECANMTGRDVAELYAFLEANPDLHTNGIRLWQGIKEKVAGHGGGGGKGGKGKGKGNGGNGWDKEDEVKVALAIGRFSSSVPVGSRARR